MASLVFPENEPPVGLIKGDVTDDKSIMKLSEEERKQFQEKERKEIQQHQRKIAEDLRKLQEPLPSKQTLQTNLDFRENPSQK